MWIGAEEDNVAWEYLLHARETYERFAPAAKEDKRRVALEELLIAEGSDWCWWYGPEHDSANRPEFDRLFRDHLANVYRALGQTPPDELSRPILKVAVAEFHQPPTGPIRPSIEGDETSFFEWLGAGLYRVDTRSGAMHGSQSYIRELRYGSDGSNFFVRLDFLAAPLENMEVRINLRPWTSESTSCSLRLRLEHGAASSVGKVVPAGVQFAFHRLFELCVPLASINVEVGLPVGLQVSVWEEGLPVDTTPQQGWLECSTAEPTDWPL